MMEFYQSIPDSLDPIAFSIGFFSMRWYAIFYVISFFLGLALVFLRIHKGEDKNLFKDYRSVDKYAFFFDLFLVGFVGILLGGRLGYAIFYEFSYFLENPLSLVSPFKQDSGEYTGIFGMSYFGAVLGLMTSSYFFLKRKNIRFWETADFIVPAISGVYFFGRLGNFINGELFGIETKFFLGMHFFGQDYLRHPSQLYEAFFEGFVIFIILWTWRNKGKFEGQITSLYLILYALFRFFTEFFRQQSQSDLLFGSLSKGQFFSVLMMFLGFWIYFRKRKKDAII